MSGFSDMLRDLTGRYPITDADIEELRAIDRPKLTPDQLRLLVDYDPDTGAFVWKARPVDRKGWNKKHAGTPALNCGKGNNGYLAGLIFKRKVYAHRAAWAITYGYWPEYADHIDRDKKNNRISNLREVSNLENSRNATLGKNNTSGHFGVCWHSRGKFWTATICVDYRGIYLGSFPTKDEAIAARKAAELKYGFFEGHGGSPVGGST